MIKYSKDSDEDLERKLQDKFSMLKIKISEEQGIDVYNMQYNTTGSGIGINQ